MLDWIRRWRVLATEMFRETSLSTILMRAKSAEAGSFAAINFD